MSVIDGQWAIEIATPMGTRKFALVLATEGESLSGTANGSAGESVIKDAVVDGDAARFAFDITAPFPLTLKLDLAFTQDAVAGKAKTGPFPASDVTGRRADSA